MKLFELPIVFNDTPGTRKWLKALIDGDYAEMSSAQAAFKQLMSDAHYDLLREIRKLAREIKDL